MKNIKQVINILVGVLLVVVGYVAFFFLIKNYVDLPQVTFSHTTGKPVRIYTPQGDYKATPKNLPDKYERIPI